MLFIAFLTLFIVYSTGTVDARETVNDAARIGRRLIHETSIGTMATRYSSDHPTLAGMPFALQEYYASCFTNGSLLLLFLPISRHSRNILASPGHTASISMWHNPSPSADQPRISLMGNVTVLRHESELSPDLKDCYLSEHPDAKWWLPEDPESAHISFWARFDPVSVYFVGGFGDEHYIGEIPLNLYQEVSYSKSLRVQ
ncbi:hypothetical protein M422DRAFT_29406 [Sphaerobolus stellatus SS14]|uniref:CREG-like beta-barrel domain-containing protein n=1 Tax=Sphaerobolus stellatus (strain SS14) TaxID=990650 RepID=A0A0C9W4J0_SPHS4|nr:hypothetical protein M422DRAFT_29406 [Sphaerobolus stellatus SS14]